MDNIFASLAGLGHAYGACSSQQVQQIELPQFAVIWVANKLFPGTHMFG